MSSPTQAMTRADRVRRLNRLPATELTRAIATGETTCEAVVRECLERIDARENEIHAWTNLDPEMALRQARALDRCGAQMRERPLHGVPIGVKDIIDTADLPTENGLADLSRAPAENRCRLRRPGARGRRRHPRQDGDVRVRRHDAGAYGQPAQHRAYARGVIERIGRGGFGFHGAGRIRNADRRLGASSGILLRRIRLQADLRGVQPQGRLSRGRKPRHAWTVRPLARRHRARERGAGAARTVPAATARASAAHRPLPYAVMEIGAAGDRCGRRGRGGEAVQGRRADTSHYAPGGVLRAARRGARDHQQL